MLGKTSNRRQRTVAGRRLRAINPRLRVIATPEPVEQVPLGRLRASVIVAALDSRRARQFVNEAAWRLGVPWIDAGVDGANLLARVNVYMPASDPSDPCLECAWDQRDYDLVEQVYPCLEEATAPAPTNAPSYLGALAASLEAIECEKLIRGEKERAACGKEVLIDGRHHRYFVTSYARNPACRFDHRVWEVERLEDGPNLTLSEALALPSRRAPQNSEPPPFFRVAGKYFVTQLICPACKAGRALLRLASSLDADAVACRRCWAK
jgi:molybdopterin/thiamine biosynthesis adenylyltransferase